MDGEGDGAAPATGTPDPAGGAVDPAGPPADLAAEGEKRRTAAVVSRSSGGWTVGGSAAGGLRLRVNPSRWPPYFGSGRCGSVGPPRRADRSTQQPSRRAAGAFCCSGRNAAEQAGKAGAHPGAPSGRCACRLMGRKGSRADNAAARRIGAGRRAASGLAPLTGRRVVAGQHS